MRIYIVESMALDAVQKARLAKLGKVKYFEGIPDLNELLKRVEGADIICCDWSPIDAAIPRISGTKLISLPFTGVGFLPLKEAAAKGIRIANSPGPFTESVGEFGIGLMLAVMRKIYLYARNEPKLELSTSPYGKIILILGAGRIGNYVGKQAEALGMRVLFWKRSDRLETMLKGADVVYCALPLSDETKGLLGEKEFTAMKHGAYFVTTSHHQIYDNIALLKALDRNLAGAAIDLEGINCGDYKSEIWQKLKNHPKILLTPHVAFKSDYGQKRAYDIMIDNIETFIKDKPQNIVN